MAPHPTKQNGPQALVFANKACGPPGGLFGIDQEVVTLRGLYGNSGCVSSTLLTDLRQAESILTSPVVCGL
jgi:hypothetical protein